MCTEDDYRKRLTQLNFQRSDIDVSLASSSGYTSLITACYKNQVRFYQLSMHILHHCIWNFHFSKFDKISSQGWNSATSPGSRWCGAQLGFWRRGLPGYDLLCQRLHRGVHIFSIHFCTTNPYRNLLVNRTSLIWIFGLQISPFWKIGSLIQLRPARSGQG